MRETQTAGCGQDCTGSSLDIAAWIWQKVRGIKEACDLDGGMGRSHLIEATQDEGRSLKWERVNQGPEQGLENRGAA